MIFKNLWLMLLGFSCDDTCLSWLEFILYLSMWAYILVYIFEFIMDAMMMMLHTFMLWYDTLYDDNACDNDVHYEVVALLYNMMYMHTIVWWCSPMHYDVYLIWWFIHGAHWDDDDAYPMTMMHTYDDDAWQCMPYVQWKQRRIIYSVTVYDMMYKDV